MRLRILVTLCWAFATLPLQADIASWTAASGQFPDEMFPYQVFDTATPEEPQLVGGELVLTTSDFTEYMSYYMSGPDIAIEPVTEIRFGLRLGPGTSYVATRGQQSVYFTLDGSAAAGNGLHFNDGIMFLNVSDAARGSFAAVDTTSSVHDYLIRVTGNQVGSPIEVYRNGQLEITGELFSSPEHNTAEERVAFGQGSTYSRGTGYWTYFEHNAMTPEPGTFVLLAMGAGFLARALRGRQDVLSR